VLVEVRSKLLLAVREERDFTSEPSDEREWRMVSGAGSTACKRAIS
jgi:hypothetical protein